MRRAWRYLAVLALAALLLWRIVVPPAAIDTASPPDATVRGAYHIHTDRSDGSGTTDEVAAAASQAGLQFIILTDHGDGTRVPDSPAYRHGVLTIDAVELNTSGGHYAALGLPAAPYPLAGTPEAVIEDVRRLGGFGIAAHPGSPRPSLQWTDWTAPVDGLEWINADSEWRDESRLRVARALAAYLFRAPQAMATLLDRPAPVIETWDRLSRTRPMFAIAGSDAHARLGLGQQTDPDLSEIHVPLPGYASTFRTFSNHVLLDAPLSGDAGQDAARILTAIKEGRLYSAIDALASPGSLAFTAASGARTAQMGEDLPLEGAARLRVMAAAPPGSTIVLLRDGARVDEVTGSALDSDARQPGVYRVEVLIPNAPGAPPVPWLLSNPIYVGLERPAAAGLGAMPIASSVPARMAEAVGEQGQRDRSVVEHTAADGAPRLAWSFALANGHPDGQFAALQLPISGGLAAYDRVRFSVSSPKPVRAWVQLRAPVGNTERWGTTFYADAGERVVDLAFATFKPIGDTSSELPPLARVASLLFVADTLNFLPGATGSMQIRDVAFVR